MIKVYIDFETKSAAPLKDCGPALYSEHLTTDILCAGYGSELITEVLKAFELEEDKSSYLRFLAANPEAIFIAHNAIFEQWIWENVMVKKYHYPSIPIERWRCTMAKSYANGLPGKLKDVAKVLQLPVQKDMDGRDNMLGLSKPKTKRKITLKNIKMLAKKYNVAIPIEIKDNFDLLIQMEEIKELFDCTTFWTPEEKPEKFEKLYSYCATDVEVCKLIDESLPDLDPVELKTWHFDQEMNKTGVLIDRPLVEKVVNLIDTHNGLMLNEFSLITGLDSPRQRGKFKEWLSQNGIDVDNTQKVTMAALKPENPTIVRAIEISTELAKSSVAKYYSMLDMSLHTGLIREIDQYHAAHTGRYGGRGVQFQNLPRQKPLIQLDEISLPYEELIKRYPDLMAALSSVLRQMIIPFPGTKFLIGDYAQMEARVLAWLAGEQWVLDAFRSGQDLYCIEASNIFGRTITKEDKDERQIGKVAILALGYHGGIGAFGNMARGYGCDLHPVADQIWQSATEEEQDKASLSYQNYLNNIGEDTVPLDEAEGTTADIIKQRWRKNNPNIVKFWKWLRYAAQSAITGKSFSDKWVMDGDFLICTLPSGRPMVYPFPRYDSIDGISYYSSTARETGFREYTHGGKLAENITQAMQRDLLRDAMLDMKLEFTPAIFHVHDEIVCVSHQPEIDLPIFEDIMKRVRKWCLGLPIDVDAKIVERYEK